MCYRIAQHNLQIGHILKHQERQNSEVLTVQISTSVRCTADVTPMHCATTSREISPVHVNQDTPEMDCPVRVCDDTATGWTLKRITTVT